MREIGVSNITLFEVKTDELGAAPTFDTVPTKLPWAVNVTTEEVYAEGASYGDNIVESASKKISSINVTLEVSSNTPPVLDAKITGKGYKDGMAYRRAGEGKTPKWAIGYEILMDDGNVRRKMLYNVTLTRPSQENSTIEESYEGKTYTYEGIAIPLVSTKDIEGTMDLKEIEALTSPNKDKAKKAFEQMFTKVILPDDIAKITIGA